MSAAFVSQHHSHQNPSELEQWTCEWVQSLEEQTVGGISAECNTTSTLGRSASFYCTLDLYLKFLIYCAITLCCRRGLEAFTKEDKLQESVREQQQCWLIVHAGSHGKEASNLIQALLSSRISSPWWCHPLLLEQHHMMSVTLPHTHLHHPPPPVHQYQMPNVRMHA